MYRFLFLGLLLLPLAAHGATYTVSPNGNDSSCSNIRTIHYGIQNCARSPGDILDIRDGTYPEQLHRYDTGLNWPSGTAQQRITIRGHAGEQVIIRPATRQNPYDMVYGQNASYLTFDNLIFDGADLGDTQGQLWKFDDSHHIRVQNCIFRNGAERNAIQAAGPFHEYFNNEFYNLKCYAWYVGGSDNLFDGNYVHDTGGYALHLYNSYQSCPNFDCVNRNVVRNNRFLRNSCTSLFPGSGQCSGAAVVLGQGTDNQVYNNEIRDQCRNGVQYYDQTKNGQIAYNTIVGSGEHCMATGDHPGGGNTFRNNLCYGSGAGDFGGGAQGEVTRSNNWLAGDGDPKFANYGAGDVRLTPSSPDTVRNGAQPLAGITTDRSNATRDSTPSIGAYEFGAAVTPTLTPLFGTFFLTPTGTNTTDCAAATGTVAKPSSQPFGSYAVAAQCLLPGSTLYLRAGVYPPLDSSRTPFAGGSAWSAPTTLRGFPGETATLQATAGGPVVWLRNPATDHFLVLKDLVLDGNQVSGTNGFAAGAVSEIRLEGVEIKQTYFEAVYLHGTTNITFQDTPIHHTTLLDLVGLQQTSNVVFTGATLHHSAANGIASVGVHTNQGLVIDKSVISNAGKALVLQGTSGLKLTNTLLYSNTQAVQLGAGVSGAELYYNTAWDNSAACMVFDSGVTTGKATNNICWASNVITNTAGAGMVLTTNQTTDPLFASTTPGDPLFLHLGAGSTARDSGTPIAGLTTDMQGKSRPDPPGGGVDRGAFEAVPGGTVPEPSPPASLGLKPPFRTT
jgi:Right handed beta helix region